MRPPTEFRFRIPALALSFAIAAAGAPALAQDDQPGSAPAPPVPTAPSAPDPLQPPAPLDPISSSGAAFIGRELFPVSLLSDPCADDDFGVRRRCRDRKVDGKGVGCTSELALTDLLEDIETRCPDECAVQTCTRQERVRQCILFGFNYKKGKGLEKCEEVTAPQCKDETGFVCRTNTTCTCICPPDA